MMISPEYYYEEYLKGKNEKQILSAIRGLKNHIGYLKNVMENPNYGTDPIIRQAKMSKYLVIVYIFKELSRL